ncbi:MAG: oligosaccharide flippase family protein, partial [Muribaculaceae bacterium]|nr:oligosaccharide flippase family protein [Muribaculaceae bacterium]
MPSVRNELTKGVFWIAVAKYSGIVISLVVTAILARNVSPAAFGTMAVATIIMAFLDIFSDMGLGVAIIQFKDLTKDQIRSLFSISVFLAVILTAILFFTADTIAEFYNDGT